MPGRSFTEGEKQTAIALARLTTVDQTATTLNIDRRTLRSWLATAPPAEDADAWRAAQQLAQQQLLTGLATGKVKHPSILATVAGIAARNLRFAALLRQREARRQGEQPATDGAPASPYPASPFQAAIDRLSDQQQKLVRDLIELELERLERRQDEEEQPPQQTEAEQEAGFLAWLARIAALTPEQVATERTAVSAELDKVERARTAGYQAARDAERQPAPPPAEPAQEPREPRTPPPVRHAPDLVVLRPGQHIEDHPSWTPYWREDQ